MNKCEAKTKSNKRCKLNCENNYCHLHQKKICSVCLNQIKNNTKSENCIHSFCKKCIYKWLHVNVNCPCCREYMGDNLINQARFDGILLNELKIVTIYNFFTTNELVRTILPKGQFIRYEAWKFYYNNLSLDFKNLLDNNVTLEKKRVLARPYELPGKVYIYFN